MLEPWDTVVVRDDPSELLMLELARERAGALRSRWVHVVAALGIPVWGLAIFPGLFDQALRRACLGAFAASCLAVGLTWFEERALVRRLQAALTRLGHPPAGERNPGTR